MGYPEIILLAWYAIALIQTLLKHGTPARLGLTTVVGTIGVPILLAWGRRLASGYLGLHVRLPRRRRLPEPRGVQQGRARA